MSMSTTRSSSMKSPINLSDGESAHTTSLRKKSNDIEAFQKQLDNNKELVLKTALLSSKYQSIGGGDSGNNMASQMLTLSTTMAELSMHEANMTLQMENMELQKQASFAQMSQMVGQRVSIDDSSRSFLGQPGEHVKFQYNILGKDIPANALIQTQISLLDKDGKKIFSQTQNGKHIGTNSFDWDGKDTKGNKVEAGSYTISVTSSYTMPGSDKKPISLTTTSVREGTVDQVTRDKDDNIDFIVDGKKVDRSSIISISQDGKKDLEEANGPISEYISYIGQKVQIKQEKVNFNNNRTTLPFISKNDATKAKVEVRFFDSAGNFIAYSQNVQDIHKGQNDFSWNGWNAKSETDLKDMKDNKTFSYVPVGVYRYEVSVTSNDSNGTETNYNLDNNGEFVIDSIDKSNGKIMLTSGKYKFDIRDVKKLTNPTPEKAQPSHIALLQEGSELIGKVVSFNDDTITYDGTKDANIYFNIANPGAGFSLHDASINIMDKEGAVIANIGMPSTDIYPSDATPVPGPVNTIKDVSTMFNATSQIKIRDAYFEKFPNGDINNITEGQNQYLNRYISRYFRAGEIFQAGHDTLPPLQQEAQRLKNMGMIKTTWDGKGLAPDNKQFSKGDYKIAISYNIKNNASNSIHSENLPLIASIKVVGTHVEDNEVILDLNNGETLPSNQVISVSM